MHLRVHIEMCHESNFLRAQLSDKGVHGGHVWLEVLSLRLSERALGLDAISGDEQGGEGHLLGARRQEPGLLLHRLVGSPSQNGSFGQVTVILLKMDGLS